MNSINDKTVAQIYAFLPRAKRIEFQQVCRQWYFATSTSINNLADESLAHIFTLLTFEQRLRLEITCAHWRGIARTQGWTGFRTLTLNGQQLAEVAKYRVLIDRCGHHLRELRFVALGENNLFVEQHLQWNLMPELRNLRFDSSRASAHTLHAVADNLGHLQSVHFSDVNWLVIAELRNLLRYNNASLQALRLPLSNDLSAMPEGGITALPHSLRSLHINAGPPNSNYPFMVAAKRDRVHALLDCAYVCCPKLAILMLPMEFPVNEQSLGMLAGFDKLFYLRLCFHPTHAPIFANSLIMVGPRLRALLLEVVDSMVLHQIAENCPMLEHCYLGISSFPAEEEEGLLPDLQAVFQIANLRSVSISYDRYSKLAVTQILAAIDALATKRNMEFLHLSRGLPLSIKFITSLFQHNPMRKLTCAIRNDHTSIELDNLRRLLQNMDRPIELELFGHCPAELQMGENSKVRVRVLATGVLPESISQPILRHFLAQTMDSVPSLGDLDD